MSSLLLKRGVTPHPFLNALSSIEKICNTKLTYLSKPKSYRITICRPYIWGEIEGLASLEPEKLYKACFPLPITKHEQPANASLPLSYSMRLWLKTFKKMASPSVVDAY